MMNIDWNFVIGTTLLIVNSLVALVDFLQGGIIWPLLIATGGLQLIALRLRGLTAGR